MNLPTVKGNTIMSIYRLRKSVALSKSLNTSFRTLDILKKLVMLYQDITVKANVAEIT